MKFSFGFDDDWNGLLVMQCPRCGETTKEKLVKLELSRKLVCPCGFTVALHGRDLKGAEDSLSAMRAAMEKLTL